MPKSAVAVKESAAISLVSNDVPAHVRAAQGAGRGNEDVGNAVAIPRIKLLQKMSPEVDKYNAKHIEGADVGHFINSISSEVYGEELYAVSLKFKVEYVVWRSMEAGGGLLGNFTNQADAEAAVAAQEKPSEYEIKDTHSHILLLKTPSQASCPIQSSWTSQAQSYVFHAAGTRRLPAKAAIGSAACGVSSHNPLNHVLVSSS